jgi:protease-4
VAAAADYAVAPPLAEWDVKGLAVQPTYFKQTLARFGVEVDVVRVAPWKTALDSFMHERMSDEERAQYEWLLSSLYGSLVDAIAAGRKLPPETVRDLIDQAPLTAEAARAAGLFDAVAYEDELPVLLGHLHAPAATDPAKLKRYRQVKGLLLRRARRQAPAAVGVISLRGSITTGPSRSSPVPLPLFGDETLGSSTAQQLIRNAAKDESLAAVVVHVDSPGGSALASDLMWRELAQLNRRKPLIVYMGDVAASGGYYIAAPGRKIVAQRATMTGSIGVIMAKAVTAGAYEKLGVGWDTVQRGQNADLYSGAVPWQGEQRAVVERNLQHVYTEFKQRVAEGRGIPLEKLDDLAGGRVWTGEQALAHGLVDILGDFDVAVETACAAAALPTDGSVQVVDISEPGRPLLAEPIKAVEAVLGLMTRGQALLWADGIIKTK